MTDQSNPSQTVPDPAAPVSATGVAPQSSSPSPSPEVVEQDWGSLLGDVEQEDPAPAPVAAAPEPPAPAPVEPAQPTPPEPAALAEPVVAQPPAQPEGPTPEWRQGVVRQLTPRYEFAPETIEAFQEAPEKVLPQLAAQVHANIIEDVARMIDAANQQILPKILEGHFSQRDQAAVMRERERELVHVPYPKLREADPDVVRSIAKGIAKAHPTSKPADRVRMLAEKVYAAEGWEMPWKGTPAAPVAPVAARPNGYTPVAPGAGGAGGPPRPADNPFSDPDLLN
jgi:hypothetical protein